MVDMSDKRQLRWSQHSCVAGSNPALTTNLRINYPKTDGFETIGFDIGVWGTVEHSRKTQSIKLSPVPNRETGLRFDSFYINKKKLFE